MKTKIINRVFSIATVCAALFLLRCVGVSGGGSEAGNARISGRVVSSLGAPVSDVKVTVLPSDFDPVKGSPLRESKSGTTRADGWFEITVRQGCTYTIQAVLASAHTRSLVAGVMVGDSDIAAPECTLGTPGTVKIMLPDSADYSQGYVYVPGTTIYSYLGGAGGYAVLDSVPAGIIPEVSYSSKTMAASAVIRHDVAVTRGDTTTVRNPSWKYAQRLYLNTTPSGAGVAGNVTDVPVLVRLRTENFDFSRAKVDGSDLMFTDGGGVPLPFEIVRWDPAAGLAEVWVRVGTVRGNDSTQSVTMYSGASTPSTPSTSSGAESNNAAVFDSSAGFGGVWHLNETSGKVARDASDNGFAGAYKGELPKSITGSFGTGQNIVRPDSDCINIGNVLNPGTKSFSIGVWFKRRTLGLQQALFAKTNGNIPSAAYGYLLNFDADNIPRFYMASGGSAWGDDSTFDVAGNLPVTDTSAWHHVLVVIDRSDNTMCKMYLDGADRTGIIGGNITRLAPVINDCNVHIGTESDNNCSFAGFLGEVTFAFAVRSADWAKLCYANQKSSDALMIFR